MYVVRLLMPVWWFELEKPWPELEIQAVRRKEGNKESEKETRIVLDSPSIARWGNWISVHTEGRGIVVTAAEGWLEISTQQMTRGHMQKHFRACV